jgi:hypothetical protein
MRSYPSYQALRLADRTLESIADQVPGYRGRLGANWYWNLHGGIVVTFGLDFTVTEQRWDVLRAEAVTPRVGMFSAADFPFGAYGTLADSPPFIHDLDGVAEWSNRLYFQMGYLIEDAVLWLQTLVAAVLDPQVHPPASFPALTALERELVTHALTELNGHFRLRALHETFKGRISYRAISNLATLWETTGLLTEQPRRVTIALRALVDQTAGTADTTSTGDMERTEVV